MRIPTGSERPWVLSTHISPREACSGLRSPIRAPAWAGATGKGCAEPARATTARRLTCRFLPDPARIARTITSIQFAPGAPSAPARVFLPVTAPSPVLSEPATNPTSGRPDNLLALSARYAAQSRATPLGGKAATFNRAAEALNDRSRPGMPMATALLNAPVSRLKYLGPDCVIRGTCVTPFDGQGSSCYSTVPAICPEQGHPAAAHSRRAESGDTLLLEGYTESSESPGTRGGEDPYADR